jgi:hypothetical protein
MITDRELATHGHVVRLAVEETDAGWDVEERRDAAVVHVEHHNDWHRVELAMLRLEREKRCTTGCRKSLIAESSIPQAMLRYEVGAVAYTARDIHSGQVG